MIIVRRVIGSRSTANFNLGNRADDLLARINAIESAYKQQQEFASKKVNPYSYDDFVESRASGKNISPPKVSTASPNTSVNSDFKASLTRGGIPAPLIGAALGVGTAATAHYFWRKRRSKNGKQVIERVRRK